MVHEIFQFFLFAALIVFILIRVVKSIKQWQELGAAKKREARLVPPKIKTKEEREAEHQKLLKQIKIDFDNYYKKLFEDKNFVNKNTTSLEDYTINTDLNGWDLHKLAELNGIKIEMGSGWYDLAIELMLELDKTGWNRKVSSIKEKFGELRFYADSDEEDLIDEYTERSKTICEICGKPGELDSYGGWFQTLCVKHIEEMGGGN